MPDNTIIAIVNEKGGTGKTTTAVNLSAALGELGQKVLLVDLDGQAASSRWLGVEEDDRLAEALRRGGGLDPMRDVLPNVALAPASGKLDSVSHDLRPTQGGQLRKVLADVQGFDFILIDCPPSLGNRLIGNALLAATHVIVPVETSILALDGLKILLTTLDDVRDGFDHEVVLGGVVACRYDGRTRLSPLVLTELKRALPGKVFNTVIRENVKMRECPASGQSILSFATESHAAEDYRSLAREMLDEPDKWRLPAPCAIALPGQEPHSQAFAVDDLRNQASARVREATQKSASRHDEAQAPDPGQPIGEIDVLPPAVAQGDVAAPAARESVEQAPLQPSVPAWWLEPPQASPVAEAAPPASPEPVAPAAEAPASPVQELEAWLDNVEQESLDLDDEIILNDTPADTGAAEALVPAGGLDAIVLPDLDLPAAVGHTPEARLVGDGASVSAPEPVGVAIESAGTPLGQDQAAAPTAAPRDREGDEPASKPSPFATDDEASSAGGIESSSLRPKFDVWPKQGHNEQPQAQPAGQNEPSQPAGAAGTEQFPALRELLNNMHSSQSAKAQGDKSGAAEESAGARRPAWRRLFDKNLNKK